MALSNNTQKLSDNLDKAPKISDILNELKRLQVEYGDIACFNKDSVLGLIPAWPVVDTEEEVLVVTF